MYNVYVKKCESVYFAQRTSNYDESNYGQRPRQAP